MIRSFAILTSLWRRASAFAIAFWPQDNSICHKVKPASLPGIQLAARFLAFALAIFALAPGCVRQPATAQSAELATYHQGDLRLPDNPKAPKLIYVDCREGANLAPHLNQYLESALRAGKFRLADSPSKAGYILHVNILRQGDVAPDSLKAAVNSGYGSSARFSGRGANAMLVDALMVQRQIPEANRPSRQKMKNISARNALDSNQMRMGIMTDGKKHSQEEFSQAIAKELALRVEK